jgi:hypothetical protein
MLLGSKNPSRCCTTPKSNLGGPQEAIHLKGVLTFSSSATNHSHLWGPSLQILLHEHSYPCSEGHCRSDANIFVGLPSCAVKCISSLSNPYHRTDVIHWTFPYRLWHQGLQPLALAQKVLRWAHDGLNVDTEFLQKKIVFPGFIQNLKFSKIQAFLKSAHPALWLQSVIITL